jgi:hypothetical protein
LIEGGLTASDKVIFDELAIEDDRLRLMFVCCHPILFEEDQVALALKTLCGFSVPEISNAFLTTETAIAKRLTRAKKRIREAQIPFEIPSGAFTGPVFRLRSCFARPTAKSHFFCFTTHLEAFLLPTNATQNSQRGCAFSWQWRFLLTMG